MGVFVAAVAFCLALDVRAYVLVKRFESLLSEARGRVEESRDVEALVLLLKADVIGRSPDPTFWISTQKSMIRGYERLREVWERIAELTTRLDPPVDCSETAELAKEMEAFFKDRKNFLLGGPSMKWQAAKEWVELRDDFAESHYASRSLLMEAIGDSTYEEA